MKKVFFIFLSFILVFSSMGIISSKKVLANTSLAGTYYISAKHSGKVLAVENGNAGTIVTQQDKQDLDEQKWMITEVSTGIYTITNVATGLVMDVTGSSTADGTSIIQYANVGSANQQWRFVESTNGSYEIVNVHSEKNLDIDGNSTQNGANLIQWTQTGAENQKFGLEKGIEYQTEISVANNQVIEFPQIKVGEKVRIPVGNAKYIENVNGELISISELINSQTQAKSLPVSVDSINARATNASTIVDTRNVGYPVAAINLHVTYGTSGNYNTGSITHHNAYTSLTGYTLNFDWIEKQCNSRIVGTKDIYAFASGELISRLWIPAGYIEVHRQNVELSGYAFAIR